MIWDVLIVTEEFNSCRNVKKSHESESGVVGDFVEGDECVWAGGEFAEARHSAIGNAVGLARVVIGL